MRYENEQKENKSKMNKIKIKINKLKKKGFSRFARA